MFCLFYRKGYCRRANVGLQCETGLRSRIYYVLGGSVLGVWNLVESVLVSAPGGHASRIQIIRMRTDQGKRIVGKEMWEKICYICLICFAIANS